LQQKKAKTCIAPALGVLLQAAIIVAAKTHIPILEVILPIILIKIPIASLEGMVSTYFARNPEKIPKTKNNIIRIVFCLIFDTISFLIPLTAFKTNTFQYLYLQLFLIYNKL
jgi:hypothetical protein